MAQGFFITFEGIDGSGKSTQLHCLEESLTAQGEPVKVTRQPGGTAIGDGIRRLLLDSNTKSLSPLAELALMFADRSESIAEVIAPALDRGEIVLCDRFTDSTEAYQGGGRQLGSQIVLDLHARLCSGLQPDLTFLLLPDLDRSLRRALRRNSRAESSGKPDETRFEREDRLFYQRVLAKYGEIANREPWRVTVIEGDGSIDEVRRKIAEVTAERLRNR